MTILSVIFFLINMYVNYRVISVIFALFTVGSFRWAFAGFAAWVMIQSHG